MASHGRGASKAAGRRGPQRSPSAFPVVFDEQSGTFVGKTACNLLDPVAPTLEVTYTNDAACVRLWMSGTLSPTLGSLGFDTETKPAYTKQQAATASGPALLQLATAEGRCLVVQLPGNRPWHAPATQRLLDALRPALEDPSLPKVGVGVDDDCVELWRATVASVGGRNALGGRCKCPQALEVRGRVDLGGVGSVAGRLRSLANLTEALVGVAIAKPKSLQMSNWGARPPLALAQVAYAATDAWAAAASYAELTRRRPDLFHQRGKGGGDNEGKSTGAPGVKAGAAQVKAVVAAVGERTLADLSERRGWRKSARKALGAILEREREREEKEAATALGGNFLASPNLETDTGKLEKARLRRLLGDLRTDGVEFYCPSVFEM